MELIRTFNGTLNDFINNLQKCYPDSTKNLLIITDLDDTKPAEKFIKFFGSNMSKISNKDETLFDTPCLCINCDLSEIWIKSNNQTNKDVIWKYLQTLALVATTIHSKSANLEQFFDQFDDNEMFENIDGIQSQMMNIVQKLLEEDNEIDIDELDENGEQKTEDSDDNENNDKDPTKKYTEMFENTKIGNLAKEIAEDIDMSPFEDLNNMESPDVTKIMEKLVGGGGLKNLVQTVAQKLKKKMETGDVNQEELVGEVGEMMEKMKKDKKFKKMFKSKDFQGMFKEMMKQQGQPVNEDEDFSALEELCANAQKKGVPPIPPQSMRGGARRNNVRNRLRRKLEAKKKQEETSN